MAHKFTKIKEFANKNHFSLSKIFPKLKDLGLIKKDKMCSGFFCSLNLLLKFSLGLKLSSTIFYSFNYSISEQKHLLYSISIIILSKLFKKFYKCFTLITSKIFKDPFVILVLQNLRLPLWS